MPLKKLILLLGLLCLWFPAFSMAGEIVLPADLTEMDISRALEVYRPSNSQVADRAEAKVLFEDSDLFESTPNSVLMLGDSQHGYWIKGKIKPGLSKLSHVILRFEYSHLGNVSLFLKQADGRIQQETLLRSKGSPGQLKDTLPAFNIPLAEEPVSFLVYVKPEGVPYNVYNVHAKLMSLNTYDEQKIMHLIFISIVFGFIVVMFIYNLILYAYVGYKPYLYYCCYLVGLFMLDYTGTGFCYVAWPLFSTPVAVALQSLAPSIIAFSLLQFGRHVLRLENYPKANRGFLVLQGLWIGAAFISQLKADALNTWILYAQVLSLALMGGMSFYVYQKERLPGSVVFGFSFVILFLGSAFHALMENLSFEFLIDSPTFFAFYRWTENNLFHLSTMLEMAFLSLALAAFIKQAEREKFAAEKENHRLIKQTLALKEQYSAQLETEVKSRTDDLKRANRQLTEMQKMRDRFFSYITHEFRSPLTLILAPLADAKNGRFGKLDSGLDKALNTAEVNAGKMLQLVNLMLELPQRGDSDIKNRATQIDPEAIVSTVVEIYQGLLRERNIELGFDNDAKEPDIWFERHYFESLVTNLLMNAYKHTPDGGKVQLSLESDENWLHIRVWNSGSFIDAETCQRIFEPYYQQTSDPLKNLPGTGLGLSLVKEVVELFEGRVEVASSQTEGTCFTLVLKQGNAHLSKDLPHDIPSDVAPENALLESAGQESEDKTKILLVDDNSELNAYLENILVEKGYQVVTAIDGEEGYECCLKELPDLVVSDVVMPKVSGLEMLSRIRANPQLEHIPVIMLTSEADKHSQISGIEQGADDYLTKPFVPRELLARLSTIQTQRQRLTQKLLAARENTAPTPVTSVESKDIKQRALTAIRENLSDPEFNVQKLADALYMNRSTLHRQLKDKYQVNANDLILQERLTAALVLVKTDAKLIEIAYAVGFKSQSYFSKKFSEKFGMSPSVWRESNRSTS